MRNKQFFLLATANRDAHGFALLQCTIKNKHDCYRRKMHSSTYQQQLFSPMCSATSSSKTLLVRSSGQGERSPSRDFSRLFSSKISMHCAWFLLSTSATVSLKSVCMVVIVHISTQVEFSQNLFVSSLQTYYIYNGYMYKESWLARDGLSLAM